MYKQKLNNSAVFLKKLKSQCVRYTNRLFEYLKILNSRYSEKVKNFYKLKFEAQAEKQPHVTIIKYPLPVAALLLFAVYFKIQLFCKFINSLFSFSILLINII